MLMVFYDFVSCIIAHVYVGFQFQSTDSLGESDDTPLFIVTNTVLSIHRFDFGFGYVMGG